MKPNLCGIDRILRVILGIALILAAFFGYIGYWGYIGAIPLVTGMINFCPLYRLLGFKSCPNK